MEEGQPKGQDRQNRQSGNLTFSAKFCVDAYYKHFIIYQSYFDFRLNLIHINGLSYVGEFNRSNDKDERTLFVKNLPYSADEDSIGELFEGVKEVRLLRDKDSGRSRGYD